MTRSSITMTDILPWCQTIERMTMLAATSRSVRARLIDLESRMTQSKRTAWCETQFTSIFVATANNSRSEIIFSLRAEIIWKLSIYNTLIPPETTGCSFCGRFFGRLRTGFSTMLRRSSISRIINENEKLLIIKLNLKTDSNKLHFLVNFRKTCARFIRIWKVFHFSMLRLNKFK